MIPGRLAILKSCTATDGWSIVSQIGNGIDPRFVPVKIACIWVKRGARLLPLSLSSVPPSARARSRSLLFSPASTSVIGKVSRAKLQRSISLDSKGRWSPTHTACWIIAREFVEFDHSFHGATVFYLQMFTPCSCAQHVADNMRSLWIAYFTVPISPPRRDRSRNGGRRIYEISSSTWANLAYTRGHVHNRGATNRIFEKHPSYVTRNVSYPR